VKNGESAFRDPTKTLPDIQRPRERWSRFCSNVPPSCLDLRDVLLGEPGARSELFLCHPAPFAQNLQDILAANQSFGELGGKPVVLARILSRCDQCQIFRIGAQKADVIVPGHDGEGGLILGVPDHLHFAHFNPLSRRFRREYRTCTGTTLSP
jgi:hypothetical protein